MDENYENNIKENERIKDNFVEKANQNFELKAKEMNNLKDNYDDQYKQLRQKTYDIVTYETKRNDELMDYHEVIFTK